MRILQIVALLLLVLMSVPAGAAKLFHMPQEVAFFSKAGLAAYWLFPLGTIQIAGGLLALLKRYRQHGLMLMATGFLTSAIIILLVGQLSFAVFSLLPVLLSAALFLNIGKAN